VHNETYCNGRYYYREDQIRANLWMGGGLDGQDVSDWDGPSKEHAAPTLNKICNLPGQTFHKSTGTAYAYSGGMTAFGVGLTVATDWSSFKAAHWVFGNDMQMYYLWGNNAPPTEAAIVYASSDNLPCPAASGPVKNLPNIGG
jgi:hypothetical protein